MKKKHKQAIKEWERFVERTVVCGECGVIVSNADSHDKLHKEMRSIINLVAAMALKNIAEAEEAK